MATKMLIGAALAASLTLATAVPGTTAVHFGLSKSSPEADSSVPAPSEVRLWFTEAPQEGTVRVRILEAEDAGVHVEDAAQDAEDPKSFVVAMHGTLAPGAYTVSWRGMGADGHVVRDTFQFSVSAP